MYKYVTLFVQFLLLVQFPIFSHSIEPDTSLLVNQFTDSWVENEWTTLNKGVLGYDDQKRELSGASNWMYNKLRYKFFWNYEDDSVRSEKTSWDLDFENEWKVSRKEIHLNHLYNDTTIEQYWNDRGEWESQWLYSTNYNSSGLPVEETINFWDNGDWLPVVRYVYEYDNNGNKISYITQSWSSINWFNNSFEEFKYNTEDKIVKSRSYWWNENTSAWDDPINQITYHYNYKGGKTIIQMVLQYWESGTFVNYTKTYDTLDHNGNKTGTLSYIWQNDSWIPDIKLTYTYDFLGSMTEMLTRCYTTDQGWINLWRDRQEYAYYLKTDLDHNHHNSHKNNHFNIAKQNEITLSDLPTNSGNLKYELFNCRGKLIQSDSTSTRSNGVAIIKKSKFIPINPMFLKLKSSNGEIICKKRITFIDNKVYAIPYK